MGVSALFLHVCFVAFHSLISWWTRVPGGLGTNPADRGVGGCEHIHGRPLGSPTLLIPCCVTVGKSHTLSVPQSPLPSWWGFQKALGGEGEAPEECWLVV